MSRWVRFLIAMVLAVALPLQGAAAARFEHCNPSSSNAVGVAEHGAGHESAANPSASHTHHRDHASEAANALATTSDEPVDQAPIGAAKCSACAACCAGAAMAALPISFGAGVPGATQFLPVRTPAPVFLTEALERPPRTFITG